MSFLYFLEDLRNPVLDLLFSVITLCGEETVFMAVGMVVTYAMSGDAVLLRRNMRRVERGAERAIHRVERRMR